MARADRLVGAQTLPGVGEQFGDDLAVLQLRVREPLSELAVDRPGWSDVPSTTIELGDLGGQNVIGPPGA